MLTLFVGLFAYAGLSLYRWMKPLWRRIGGWGLAIGYGVLVVPILGGFVAGRTPGNPISAVIHRTHHSVVGLPFFRKTT